MPISDSLPTVTVDPTDTILGSEIIFAFLPSGGSQENFRAKVADLTPDVQKLERKAPDANGLLVTDRTVVTGQKWTLRLTSDEFNTSFIAYINTIYRTGTGKLWVVDPDDAANTASFLSNEFNCTCSPSGSMSMGAEQFTEGAIDVDINGTFTITRDGDVT